MSYVLSGYMGQSSRRVEDLSDEELAARCAQQKARTSILNPVIDTVIDTLENDPCIELALREKIMVNTKKYGPLALGVIGAVALIAGMAGSWALRR